MALFPKGFGVETLGFPSTSFGSHSRAADANAAARAASITHHGTVLVTGPNGEEQKAYWGGVAEPSLFAWCRGK